jgi:pilus assembly protein CpaE
MNARGFTVYAALEGSLGLEAIRQALPVGTPVRALSLSEAGRSGNEPQHDADLIIVGCSQLHDQALEVISAAAAQRADRPVVVLYHGNPNGFLERAFEAGADDLISLPQSAEALGFALEKALARRRGVSAPGLEGAMITVLGPKGGTGKTITSSNLAVALALEGKSTVLVDLDLQFGDVGLALGLPPTRTIYDLAVSGGSLDGDKIDGFLAQHPSGARVLLAPLRPDQAAAITMPFLREVFEILRSRYDFLLVDTPPAFTPEVIAAVDASSHLCVVGMLDALSLKDTKIGLETLEQMGHDPRAVTIVLNRADSDVGITAAHVEQLLGRAPDVLVGSDRAIPRALTNGQPIVVAEPRSKAAKSYAALAERYLTATGQQAVPLVAAVTPIGNERRRLSLRKAS